MSVAQPFGALLEALRRAGHPAGVEDALLLRRLTDRYGGSSREELRDAIAALLGRDLEGLERVRQVFDRIFPAPPPRAGASGIPLRLGGPPIEEGRRSGPTKGSAPASSINLQDSAPVPLYAYVEQPASRSRSKGGGARILVLFALGGLLAGIGWVTWNQLNPGPGHRNPSSPLDAGAGSDLADAGEPSPPAPDGGNAGTGDAGAPSQLTPPEVGRGVPSGGGGLAVAVLIISAAGVVAHRRYATARAAREALDARAGPLEYQISGNEREERRQVEELAALLASSLGMRPSRRTLDVDASVQRTARQAGYAAPVFARRRGEVPLLVLREVGPTMEPWDWSVDQLLEGLRSRGLRFDVLYFFGHPGWVSERPVGRPEALGAVARARSGAALLVIGSGDLLGDGWRMPEEMRMYPARGWLTPVDDASLWPPALRAQGKAMPVWGASRTGLVDLGRHLARGEPPSRVPRRSPMAVEARLLRAFVALAPRRTFELAHRLKRRFLPDAPDATVLAVRSLVDGGGAEMEELREAQAFLRAADAQPGRLIETAVRTFIEEEFQRAEPSHTDSVAHLRWRRDLALVRLASGTRTGEALEELEALRQTDLGIEVASGVEPRLAADAVELTSDERRRLERLSRPGSAPAGKAVERWRWPGGLVAAAALAAGAVVVVVLAAVITRPREVVQVFDAKVMNGKILIVPLKPGALDEDLWLYVDGIRRRSLRGSQLILKDGDAAFSAELEQDELGPRLQVGARLVDGRFGISRVEMPWTTLVVLATSPDRQEIRIGTVEADCAIERPNRSLGESIPIRDGICHVKVSAPGFVASVETVQISVSEWRQLDVVLQPAQKTPTTVLLRVGRLPAGISPSDVLVDGKRLSSPTVELAPGQHKVTLASPYFEYRDVTVVSAETDVLDVDAQPVFGFARVGLDVPVSAAQVRLESGLELLRPMPGGAAATRLSVRGRRAGRLSVDGIGSLDVPIEVGRTIDLRLPGRPVTTFAADAGAVATGLSPEAVTEIQESHTERFCVHYLGLIDSCLWRERVLCDEVVKLPFGTGSCDARPSMIWCGPLLRGGGVRCFMTEAACQDKARCEPVTLKAAPEGPLEHGVPTGASLAQELSLLSQAWVTVSISGRWPSTRSFRSREDCESYLGGFYEFDRCEERRPEVFCRYGTRIESRGREVECFQSKEGCQRDIPPLTECRAFRVLAGAAAPSMCVIDRDVTFDSDQDFLCDTLRIASGVTVRIRNGATLRLSYQHLEVTGSPAAAEVTIDGRGEKGAPGAAGPSLKGEWKSQGDTDYMAALATCRAARIIPVNPTRGESGRAGGQGGPGATVLLSSEPPSWLRILVEGGPGGDGGPGGRGLLLRNGSDRCKHQVLDGGRDDRACVVECPTGDPGPTGPRGSDGLVDRLPKDAQFR